MWVFMSVFVTELEIQGLFSELFPEGLEVTFETELKGSEKV
jgi:hypothetical protein